MVWYIVVYKRYLGVLGKLLGAPGHDRMGSQVRGVTTNSNCRNPDTKIAVFSRDRVWEMDIRCARVAGIVTGALAHR